MVTGIAGRGRTHTIPRKLEHCRRSGRRVDGTPRIPGVSRPCLRRSGTGAIAILTLASVLVHEVVEILGGMLGGIYFRQDCDINHIAIWWPYLVYVSVIDARSTYSPHERTRAMENKATLSVLTVSTDTDAALNGSVMYGGGHAGQSSSGCTDFREPIRS
jgi:hypothetical protein